MIKQHYGHHDDEWQDDSWSWNDGYDEWSSWYGYEDDYDYKWTDDDEQQSGDWSQYLPAADDSIAQHDEHYGKGRGKGNRTSSSGKGEGCTRCGSKFHRTPDCPLNGSGTSSSKDKGKGK
eukprot:4003656-Pyramimonas_sp.AAC.1